MRRFTMGTKRFSETTGKCQRVWAARKQQMRSSQHAAERFFAKSIFYNIVLIRRLKSLALLGII